MYHFKLVFCFLYINPQREFAGLYGSSFNFFEEHLPFSIVVAPLYIVTNTVVGVPFLHILTSISCLFDNNHSDMCEVRAH